MSAEKEPFLWTKQGAGFTDVTRWMKDTFGSIRGSLGIIFIVSAIVGCCYLGAKVADRLFPKKETSIVSQVSNTGAGKVEVIKIEKQKNSFLGLF